MFFTINIAVNYDYFNYFCSYIFIQDDCRQ